MQPGRLLKRLTPVFQLSLLLIAAWLSIATSPVPTCRFGALPFDGQTNVATDTTITFRSDTSFRSDMPAITDEAASLYLHPEGTRVETDTEVDLEQGTVTLRPRSPLEPGRAYQAIGVDTHALQSTHHTAEDTNDGRELTPVTTTFYTASAPRLLWFRSDAGSVTLVFSEAILQSSLTSESVRFSEQDADTGESIDVPWTAVTSSPGTPHILQFTLEVSAPPVTTGLVTLTDSVLAATGVPLILDGGDTGASGEYTPSSHSDNGYSLEWALGEASCSSY